MVESVDVGVVEVQTQVARELIKLLLRHPQVNIVALQTSEELSGDLADLYGEFRGREGLPQVEPLNASKLVEHCHAVFICAPHGVSLKITPELIDERIRVFDLSSDFRFRERENYRRVFGREHPFPEWNQKAVYGLPELYRPNLPGSQLVSLPGHYATATLLALAPLLRRDLISPDGIIADCKCGYSAFHRLPASESEFCEADGTVLPNYPRVVHQHAEIEEHLRRISGENHHVTLVPFLVPIRRGLLATCYVKMSEKMDETELRRLYDDSYKSEPFVRILKGDTLPRTGDVEGFNYCDISVRVERGGKQLVLLSAIDNLGKGAAGQAIQCFNLSYRIPETRSLL